MRTPTTEEAMATPTIHIYQDGTWAGTGTLVRHQDGSVTIEDCFAVLGPRGLNHESGEQQDAAERVYAAIEAAIARGEDSVALEGSVYTWEIEEPPVIEVVGLGDEDWGAEADAWETEAERLQREAARRRRCRGAAGCAVAVRGGGWRCGGRGGAAEGAGAGGRRADAGRRAGAAGAGRGVGGEATGGEGGPPSPALRANPFPEVT